MSRMGVWIGVICLSVFSGCASVPPPKTEAARYQTQLGLTYLSQGDVARAKFKLNRALDHDPTLPEAQYAMAYFLETVQDYEQAEKHYRLAIEWAERSGTFQGEAHNNYGAFLCHQTRFSEATEEFLRAATDPKYAGVRDAYENAGLCLFENQQYLEAQVYFLKALAQDPQSPNSLMGITQIALQEKISDEKFCQNWAVYWKACQREGVPSLAELKLGFSMASQCHHVALKKELKEKIKGKL